MLVVISSMLVMLCISAECFVCLFQLELKKKELDELKCQHLEEFIEKVRNELKSWWDLCYYGAGQRDQFEPYHSTDYSEELLEKHEVELDRIKSHYNQNSSLFAMVSLILRVTQVIRVPHETQTHVSWASLKTKYFEL